MISIGKVTIFNMLFYFILSIILDFKHFNFHHYFIKSFKPDLSTKFQMFLSLANIKKILQIFYCIKISHKIHDSHVRETNETTLTSEIFFKIERR